MKRLIKYLPGLGAIVTERDWLAEENQRLRNILVTWKHGFVPPGHFYSPLPDIEYVRQQEQRIFSGTVRTIPGIDLRGDDQLQLLERFSDFYPEMPFPDEKIEGLRYYFQNDYYSYSDAICLYSMLRHLKPKKYIEVGSGFSSCLALDTAELFLEASMSCTFVEPYPERLFSLLNKNDIGKEYIRVLQSDIQDVPLDLFRSLAAGDVLFIDSTHVSKVGSDVNYLLFDVFPVLQSGVYLHIHDIFFPFEYPDRWIYDGRFWNENYLLRAFLQYNEQFQIVYFNTFVESIFRANVEEKLPMCLRMPANEWVIPGSIWLRRK